MYWNQVVSSRHYWRTVRVVGTNAGLVFHLFARPFKFKQNPFVLSWEIRCKDNLSLSLLKHHCFKVYNGMVIQQRVMLRWAVDGGEWPASRLGFLSPGETDIGARWIGRWADPRASLDALGSDLVSSFVTSILNVMYPDECKWQSTVDMFRLPTAGIKFTLFYGSMICTRG
jgi:hypothetical protein